MVLTVRDQIHAANPKSSFRAGFGWYLFLVRQHPVKKYIKKIENSRPNHGGFEPDQLSQNDPSVVKLEL